MSSNSSGKRLEGFFTGKGFYIVLFLCVAVIGVSAWMMAAGNGTMAEDLSKTNSASLDNKRVETIIIPADAQEKTETAKKPNQEDVTVEAPEINTDGLADTEANGPELGVEVWQEGDVMEVAAPLYSWPVSGELERHHSTEQLVYDVTMKDWRTHEGVDILAPVGSTVTASHCGTVSSVVNDDLYGTVVTVDHGDGGTSVYANLDENTSVNVGDWVEPGNVIGTVGQTALCEIAQQSHLHFAITVNGEYVNPLNYLPA